MRSKSTLIVVFLLVYALPVIVPNQIRAQDTRSAQTENLSSYRADEYPLSTNKFERDIAIFMGLVRTDFDDAQMVYIHPNIESKFEFILEQYGEVPLKMFFQGVMPVIKYQSLISSLVLFYNPWNDLVFITEWQVFDNDLFITDMELVSTDFLKFDGAPFASIEPLWIRKEEATLIDNLYAQMEERNELFNDLWDKQLGPGNWREILFCLIEPEKIIREQSIVALRLKNHYINLQNLSTIEDMEDLNYMVIHYLLALEEGIDGVFDILLDAMETPQETMDIMVNIAPELWENSSVQSIIKVTNGAFVFINSPKLPKYFLSFYFGFNQKNQAKLKRIDWCSFDSNLLNSSK